jgi:hypothetical protein
MSKKLRVSQSRREYIKNNFSNLDKSNLKGDEKRYYTLVENGKNSASKNVRFEGKYLAGNIVDIAHKVAERKGMSLDDYLHTNRDQVNMLIESGYTQTSKQFDKAIDVVSNLKRKTVEVDTGDGIVRMTKMQAIEQLAFVEQYVKSNSKTAMIATKVKVFKNGKVRVTIPNIDVMIEMTNEELEEYLDGYDDIDIIVS